MVLKIILWDGMFCKMDGVVAEQEQARLVRGERLDTAVPQGQPETVN